MFKNKYLRIFLRFAGGALLIIFGLNLLVVLSTEADVKTQLSDIEEKNFCLLLGANPYGEAVYKRVKAVVALYNGGKVKHVLVSGDNGRQQYNEPEEMKRQLIVAGIPEKDITLDYAGFRTYDSLYRAKYVFGVDSMVIVTQPFHANRSQFIAGNVGVKSEVYVAEETSGVYYNRLRESLARCLAVIDAMTNKKAHFSGPPEFIQIEK
jgi:SanA protein